MPVCEEVISNARRRESARPGLRAERRLITKTLHGKSEVDFYEPYIRAIKDIASNPRITFEVNARPREEVRRYKDAGADNIHFNMEVWDKKLFRLDQSRQGRARWLGQLGALDGRRRGSVRSGPWSSQVSSPASKWRGRTVSRPSTEAVTSATDCFEYLMSRGIMPRPQQWRREPSTALCKEAEQPPVPLDYYIQMTRNWYECYQKYRAQLPQFGTRKAGLLAERNLLGPVHGAYGDFRHAEGKSLFPTDIEEQINRRSVPWENIDGGAHVS